MARKANSGSFTSENNPTYKLSEEELKAKMSKAGIASKKAHQERKRTKEILDIFLSMPLKKRQVADIDKIVAYEQLKGKNITVAEAIQLKQVQRALNGDLSSATYIRDSVGDKPIERVDANVKTDPFAGLTTEELRAIINEK